MHFFAGKFPPRARWVLAFLLFSAFPIGIIWLGWSMVESQKLPYQINRQHAIMKKTLDPLKAFVEDNDRLTKEIEQLNQPSTFPPILYGMINLKDSRQSILFPKANRATPLTADELVKLVRDMRFQCLTKKVFPWGFVTIASLDLFRVSFGIYLGRPQDSTSYFSEIILYFLTFSVIIFTGYFCHLFLSGQGERFVSLRLKLIGLFLYSSLFPGFSLFLLGFEHVDNRERMLVQEKFVEMAGYQRQVEDNFLVALASNIEIFQKMKESPEIAELNTSALESKTQELYQKQFLSGIFLFDHQGTNIWAKSYEGKPGAEIHYFSKRIRNLVDLLSRRGNKLTNLKQEMDLAGFLTQENMNFFPPILMDRQWIVFDIEGMKLQYFLFLSTFLTKDKNLAFMVVSQTKESLHQRFFTKFFQENKSTLGDTDPFQVGILQINPILTSLPQNFLSRVSSLEATRELALKKEVPQFRRELEFPDFLVTFSGFRWLEEKVFCIRESKASIIQTLWNMKLKVVLISVLSTLFSFLIGMTLSRQFLWPILELTTGINAIDRFEFQHRIPPLFKDELGDLGNHLNKVIPNLEEMQVGKAVQLALIPREKLKVGDFEIEGHSEPMTSMMGDYFDFFQLNERYITCLIGDVEGHGAPAALVMAMAKGGIGMLTPEDALHPEMVLKRLNETLLKTAKKKMMTMALLTIDLQEHQIHLANAGQTYPFFFQASRGTAELLTLPGSWPLGLKKRFQTKEISLPMNPGDSLVFYTDGLVEARNPLDVEMGYDRLQEIMTRSIQGVKSTNAIKIALFSHFSKFVQSAPRTDDLSLLIIRRCSPSGKIA